ncbi:MAG: CoA ester lyase [Caldilineales bacterium]|nr:CoA ester lyase [Caldilineales bacterium]
MRPRRTVLFMPGDSQRKIEKAATVGVDCIVMDLEDGVAWEQKEAARETTLHSLLTLDFGASERVVRLNPVGSGLEVADFRGTIEGKPDAYLLPKVGNSADLVWLDAMLDQFESRFEWEPGSIRVLVLIETALGVVNVRDIAQASRRCEALFFGAEDLIGDIGGVRTKSNREVHYARSKIALNAAAFGLQAIDQVFVDIKDEAGLRAECEQAVELGYRGKMAIHPDQVPIIRAAFSPNPDQIAAAQRLIDAYHEYQARGQGVFTLDGKMVDAPMLKAAEQVLARAEGS